MKYKNKNFEGENNQCNAAVIFFGKYEIFVCVGRASYDIKW